MTLADDLLSDMADVFYDTDEFAVAAVYRNRYGAISTVNGIFDAAYEGISPVTGAIESTAPQFRCATADITGAEHNETMTIDGTTYYITGIHPDGTGETILVLSEDKQ